MIWRSVVAGAYFALAIVVGVAYGGRGLVVLSFFYFWAGAWVVFLLVWGRAARAASRWNFRRVQTAQPDQRSSSSDSGNGEAQASDDAEVCADPGSVSSPATKRRRPLPAL
jgi:hypothetical protein